MKKFENSGFTSILTNDKLKIEIPISNLVCAFNNCPDNPIGDGQLKVKRGKRKEFAEFCAEYIVDECNCETGDTYLTEAFDRLFNQLFEGFIIADEFIEEVKEYEDEN